MFPFFPGGSKRRNSDVLGTWENSILGGGVGVLVGDAAQFLWRFVNFLQPEHMQAAADLLNGTARQPAGVRGSVSHGWAGLDQKDSRGRALM